MTVSSRSAVRLAVTSRAFSKNAFLRESLLSRYEQVKFNDTGRVLRDGELVEFLRDHPRAIVSLEPLNDEVLTHLPELKVVSKYGVGLDNLDLGALKRRGIRLGWKGGVNKRSVSELVLAFAIACLRDVVRVNAEMRSGLWNPYSGGQLSGRTVGIIGCGHIGKDLVSLLKPFGCKVLAHDIRDYSEFYAQSGVTSVGLEELLRSADIVTLHVPYNESTHLILSAERLALMKKTAIVINTARGGLVDEVATREMLKSGRLAAAAFDVYLAEPPTDKELLGLPNFLGTPHIGGSSAEAIRAMGLAAIDGLEEAVEVQPEMYL